MAHYLESWGDALTSDGAYLSIQPMILPLFGGLSEIELMNMLLGGPKVEGPELVQETFRATKPPGDFQTAWSHFLRDGFAAHAVPGRIEARILMPAPRAARSRAKTLGVPTCAHCGIAGNPESSDEGVKYFGGTATYTKTVQASADWFKSGSHVWLDLGDVKNLAEVSINGKPLGIVWKKPYRVDATGVLKAGANSLEIKVINGWANRIIGDRQPGAAKQYTFTSPKFYKADAALMPSGLLGPVQIIQSSVGK